MGFRSLVLFGFEIVATDFLIPASFVPRWWKSSRSPLSFPIASSHLDSFCGCVRKEVEPRTHIRGVNMAGRQGTKEYLRAAKFLGEESAGDTYFQIEAFIFRSASDADLSVYRFIRNGIWHVAVVGDRPPDRSASLASTTTR